MAQKVWQRENKISFDWLGSCLPNFLTKCLRLKHFTESKIEADYLGQEAVQVFWRHHQPCLLSGNMSLWLRSVSNLQNCTFFPKLWWCALQHMFFSDNLHIYGICKLAYIGNDSNLYKSEIRTCFSFTSWFEPKYVLKTQNWSLKHSNGLVG